MHDIVALNIGQFSLIYLLLILVLAIMKKSKIEQSRLLFWASVKMSIQLMLTGFILEYIFDSPKPIYVAVYLTAMLGFATHRTFMTVPGLNKNFKLAVLAGIVISSLFVLAFFVLGVVGESVLNPQYTIPLAGMLVGNSMTGVGLGIRSFMQSIEKEKLKINTLVNLGVAPQDILRPFANNALETAILPTLNSMVSMGIVSLPGMMTGQILSGTSPTNAIMYQIAIMIAICASVCLCVFISINWGYKSLYNSKQQFEF